MSGGITKEISNLAQSIKQSFQQCQVIAMIEQSSSIAQQHA